MAVKLRWNGASLMFFTKKALFAGVRAAAVEHQRIARKKASILNTAKRHRRVRDTSASGGGIKGSQYSTRPHSSRPGESPRRRTGVGQKSIVRRTDRKRGTASVGYTRAGRHMHFHEVGIRYSRGVQKRPTILPALVDNEKRIGMIAVNAALRVKPKGGRRRR